MKRILVFAVMFLLILLLCSFLPVHGEDEIYDSVIRLHVIANSDGELDQTIKLAVRDNIIGLGLFGESETLPEAAELIGLSTDALTECTLNTLSEYGADYGCRVEWGTERYPTRIYEDVTYPAGNYKSLRIILGEGEGKNWWCVLFPPLCTSKAVANESLMVSNEAKKTFTAGEKKYTIRLKILEWLSFYD